MKHYRNISTGLNNNYLISGKNGYILIDTGRPNYRKKFFDYFHKEEINPEQILLIVITHAHHDHVGNLKFLKEWCGCPIAIHTKEAHLIQNGIISVPPGTMWFSKPICSFAKKNINLIKPLFAFESVDPDILIEDELSLESFGFSAKIITTPGHSSGSVSILMENGDAFVGDLSFNVFPFGLGPIFPPFAEDVELLLKSWEKIIKLGVKTLYPGHGDPFDINRLIEVYNQRTQQV